MSEEILKALTQLFAIITKQGGVTENERQFVITFFKSELDQASIKDYVDLYDEISGYKREHPEEEKTAQTSVKDSIKTLSICKKINKTLTQKQKVVVLIKLIELVVSDGQLSPQRNEIISTVSTVFNIVKDEYKLIETFIVARKVEELNFPDILVANQGSERVVEQQKHIHAHLAGHLIF